MSRKYLNDRWCARCSRNDPTPYLRDNTKHLPKTGTVLDVGCGNGRNSEFMKSLGYQVTSVDMVDDYGIRTTLGKDPLPSGPYNIVLANYILMFLDDQERSNVLQEINKQTQLDSILFIEMYAAKDAYTCDLNDSIDLLKSYGWTTIRKSKDRSILKKEV